MLLDSYADVSRSHSYRSPPAARRLGVQPCPGERSPIARRRHLDIGDGVNSARGYIRWSSLGAEQEGRRRSPVNCPYCAEGSCAGTRAPDAPTTSMLNGMFAGDMSTYPKFTVGLPCVHLPPLDSRNLTACV
jgi:hypothetical protein